MMTRWNWGQATRKIAESGGKLWYSGKAIRPHVMRMLVAEFEDWMRTARAGLSRHAAVAKAMGYMLKRRDGFARFFDDGRICLTNNAAERALRPLCLRNHGCLPAPIVATRGPL